MNNNITYDKATTMLFLERYKHLEDIVTSQNMSLVKKYYNDDYELFRSLRNILAHESVDNDFPFIISQGVLSALNRLITVLETPAINCSVTTKNLFKAHLETPLYTILKGMTEHHFSHIPIVDKNNGYIAMLTERSCTELLYLNPSPSLLAETVQDLFNHYNLTPAHVIFVAPETSKLALQDAFLKGFYDTHRLDAVLITEQGDAHQPIQGMMTRGDVLLN